MDLVFLHGFVADIRKPVVLDGREHIEYVPTQIVTEYLRFLAPANVDGLLFQSAQTFGVNCVIFSGAEGAWRRIPKVNTRCCGSSQEPRRS